MTEMLSSSRLRTPPRDQICFAPRGPASLRTPPEGPTFLTMLDPDTRHDARSSHGCKRKLIPRVSTMARDSIHSDEPARKLNNKPLGRMVQGPRFPRETILQPTRPTAGKRSPSPVYAAGPTAQNSAPPSDNLVQECLSKNSPMEAKKPWLHLTSLWSLGPLVSISRISP